MHDIPGLREQLSRAADRLEGQWQHAERRHAGRRLQVGAAPH